ncbi:hypothetical protein [Nocardia niigatensis]
MASRRVMRDAEAARRKRAAAVKADHASPALPLWFNVDSEGHQYDADLFDQLPAATGTEGNPK